MRLYYHMPRYRRDDAPRIEYEIYAPLDCDPRNHVCPIAMEHRCKAFICDDGKGYLKFDVRCREYELDARVRELTDAWLKDTGWEMDDWKIESAVQYDDPDYIADSREGEDD